MAYHGPVNVCLAGYRCLYAHLGAQVPPSFESNQEDGAAKRFLITHGSLSPGCVIYGGVARQKNEQVLFWSSVRNA